MEANWNHLTDEWSSNILKLVKRLFELALTCSDKLWPILLSHFNAFQMKLARGPCRLVSLSVISEYVDTPCLNKHLSHRFPLLIQQQVPIPLLQALQTDWFQHNPPPWYPWISNSAFNNTQTHRIHREKSPPNKYYIVRSNDQQSMTWRSCLRSCAVGGFCCVFGFRILGQTNQQNAPRQSKLEQVQEDRVNTQALHQSAT